MENITREKLKITFINIKNNVKISRKLVSRFLEGGKKSKSSPTFSDFFSESFTLEDTLRGQGRTREGLLHIMNNLTSRRTSSGCTPSVGKN